jgi:VIT1/CCC1 family predicted Fe2+/Mn2+ transporter
MGHQLITGISFGLTTSVITSLGMIVGVHSATGSKLAVVSGIVIMAIADGLSDAISLHTAEEADVEEGRGKHTPKEIWLTTLFTFISVSGSTLTFAVPLLLFALETAIYLAIAWGMLVLILLNLYIAKIRNESALKLTFEHILLAILVIIVSRFTGDLVAIGFKFDEKDVEAQVPAWDGFLGIPVFARLSRTLLFVYISSVSRLSVASASCQVLLS